MFIRCVEPYVHSLTTLRCLVCAAVQVRVSAAFGSGPGVIARCTHTSVVLVPLSVAE